MSTGSRRIWPTAFAWPVEMKLRRRNSSAGRPAAAATRSICSSRAKIDCGAPKPRNAPCGGAVVATAFERMRTFGTGVRTGGVNRAARQHDGRQRAVRAAVDDELDVHRHEPAVGVDGRAVPRPRRVPLGRGDHVLEPVVDHLHRPARLPREQRGVARRESTDIPPCRRTRRRSPSGRRECVRRAGRTARRARDECSRGTASSPTPSRPTAGSATASMPFGSM